MLSTNEYGVSYDHFKSSVGGFLCNFSGRSITGSLEMTGFGFATVTHRTHQCSSTQRSAPRSGTLNSVNKHVLLVLIGFWVKPNKNCTVYQTSFILSVSLISWTASLIACCSRRETQRCRTRTSGTFRQQCSDSHLSSERIWCTVSCEEIRSGRTYRRESIFVEEAWYRI